MSTTATDFTVPNTILSRLADYQSITVRLSAEDVPVDANGKKIVKAGTFLGSAEAGQSILTDRAAAKPANDATTEGLLFYDADVTGGDRTVAMLVSGIVGLDRIPAPPASEVSLPRVTFTID